MIKYDKKTHSFSHDSDISTSEMPNTIDIRQDKYGELLLRMTKLVPDIVFTCCKFSRRFHFAIRGGYLTQSCSSISLKDLFNSFIKLPDTQFCNKSYDEVLVMLDLLEGAN